MPEKLQLAYLVRVGGDQTGRRHAVGDGLLIGRSEQADVQLRSSDVSREHARINRTSVGQYVLEDLGSRNGTLVNGVPVKLHMLRFGDTVHIGSRCSFVFTHHNPIEAEMLEAERLDSVTQMAGGIAHHFNNLMAVLLSNLGYLQDLPEEMPIGNPIVKESVADMTQAIGRASTIVRQLLAYARRGCHEDREVNISALVYEVVEQATREPGATIEASVGPDLLVQGDAEQLKQLLVNLCRNAREAVAGRDGSVQVLARRIDIGPDQAASKALPVVGPHIEIMVRDSGIGMDAETRTRAFEPFFSTKGPTRGTGLGLAAVHGILKDHCGHISMDSEVDQGTTFWVYLPASSGGLVEADSSETIDEETSAPKVPKTLLLLSGVFGDARESLRELAEARGLDSVSLDGNRELVMRFLEHRTRIRAVIIHDEQDLPAAETVHILRTAAPDLRAAILAVRPSEESLECGQDAGAVVQLDLADSDLDLRSLLDQLLAEPS
jgi:signal transduction histidine kinase